MTLSPHVGAETVLNAMSTPPSGQRLVLTPPGRMAQYSTQTAKAQYAGMESPLACNRFESKANVVQHEVVPDVLEIEQAKYLQYMASAPAKDEDSFQFITNYMKTSQIQCFKYNNSIDKQAQSQTCFDALISLSNDGKCLVITNMRAMAYTKRDESNEQDKLAHSESSEDEEQSDRTENNPDELEP